MIGIIVALIAMLLPALTKARKSAQTVACASSVRQIMIAMHGYANASNGSLPYQAFTDYRDWSGTLAAQIKNKGVFLCASDDNPRSPLVAGQAPRSYAINSGKFVDAYVRSLGYHTPFPIDPLDLPEKLMKIPPRVMIVGENHGHDAPPTGAGNFGDSTAVVGLANFEGLDAYAHAIHYNLGANYGFSDGHVEFLLKKYIDQWRCDTDYGGDPRDPWKWKTK